MVVDSGPFSVVFVLTVCDSGVCRWAVEEGEKGREARRERVPGNVQVARNGAEKRSSLGHERERAGNFSGVKPTDWFAAVLVTGPAASVDPVHAGSRSHWLCLHGSRPRR